MSDYKVAVHYVPANVDITSSALNDYKLLNQYKTFDVSVLSKQFEKYMRAKDSLEDVRFDFHAPLGLDAHTVISSNKTAFNNTIVRATFGRLLHLFRADNIKAERNEGESITFIYRDDYEDLPGKGPIKIHLQVKHEYILHCIRQLDPLCKSFSTHPIMKKYRLEWKVNLFNRSSYSYGIHGFPHRDIGLKTVNGGVAATFVIYASSNADITTLLLKELLRVFHNEEMGLMDVRSTESLTPGHIRLNSIISYAHTDRNTMMRTLRGNVLEFPGVPHTLPPWIATMAGECTSDKKDALNAESQLYLGMNICNEDGSGINYQTKCNTAPRTEDQKYCYIPEHTLNPRIVLASEGASAGASEGASEGASAGASEGASEGASAGAGKAAGSPGEASGGARVGVVKAVSEVAAEEAVELAVEAVAAVVGGNRKTKSRIRRNKRSRRSRKYRRS